MAQSPKGGLYGLPSKRSTFKRHLGVCAIYIHITLAILCMHDSSLCIDVRFARRRAARRASRPFAWTAPPCPWMWPRCGRRSGKPSTRAMPSLFFANGVCVCVCACVLLLMGSSTKGHLECGCLLLHFLEPSDNPLVILYYRCFLNRGTCLGEGPISIHSHAFLPGQHMICQTLGRAKRKWAVSHVLYEWVSLGVMGSARARASEPGRASAHLWVNLIRDLLQQVRRQGWNGRNIQANDPSLKWAKLQRDNQARLPKSCVHMRGALPGKIQGSRKTTCWHRRLVVLLGACHAHDSRFQGVDQGFTFELCIQTRALPVDIDVPGFFMFVPWWFRRSLKQMFLIANEALSSQELSISHGFRRFFPTRAAPSLKAGSSESPHQEPPEAASWASSDAAAAGLVRGIVPASVFT